MSYTRFHYSDVSVTPALLVPCGNATVRVKVSNVGGVWLFAKTAPTPFGLGDLRRLVREFMVRKLPTILNRAWYDRGYTSRPCACSRAGRSCLERREGPQVVQGRVRGP